MANKKTETQFKVGDVVQIRSGGPLMTISHLFEDKASVTWHPSCDGHPFSAEVSLVCLKLIE